LTFRPSIKQSSDIPESKLTSQEDDPSDNFATFNRFAKVTHGSNLVDKKEILSKLVVESQLSMMQGQNDFLYEVLKAQNS
jgi:hypothetical protein